MREWEPDVVCLNFICAWQNMNTDLRPLNRRRASRGLAKMTNWKWNWE
jgi:hypothetical protein